MTPVLENILRGALGMFFLIFICYLLSNNRRAISWKLVGMGIFAQVMFAMGVLHTTFMGQPVFWILFGIILLYTVIRKLGKLRNTSGLFTYDSPAIALSLVWQIFFVGGLILASRIFPEWSSLSIFISCIVVIIIAFKIGARHAELLKWNILLSLGILTVCIYIKICPRKYSRSFFNLLRRCS